MYSTICDGHIRSRIDRACCKRSPVPATDTTTYRNIHVGRRCSREQSWPPGLFSDPRKNTGAWKNNFSRSVPHNRLIIDATYPAPNPLSMFTTLTLDAHE